MKHSSWSGWCCCRRVPKTRLLNLRLHIVHPGVCAEALCHGEQCWQCTRSLNRVSICGWGGAVPHQVVPSCAVLCFDAMSLTDKHKVKRQRLDRICEGKSYVCLVFLTPLHSQVSHFSGLLFFSISLTNCVSLRAISRVYGSYIFINHNFYFTVN